jgi:anti-sigma regulatory factor (Ser/Thr protein kinase)
VADRITLVLPAEEEYQQVANLVVGGLAVRLDLTFEHLEDLMVALDTLLGRIGGSENVSVSVTVEDGRLRASVGPFASGDLDYPDGDDGALGLRRVLETVCDTFEVERRETTEWAELTKTVGR